MTCSRGLLYLSDETGNVHVLDEKYQMNSFIAHSGVIYKIESSNRHDILVTIGTNENNQTVLKIWSISPNFPSDSTLTPRCLHQHKFDENGVVSALALHANLSHVVIGFINGKVLVLKGDITKVKVRTRDRGEPVRALGNPRTDGFRSVNP